MSNNIYITFQTALMSGAINLASADIRAALVDATYTPNLTSDQYLSTVASSIVSRSGSLSGVSVSSGTLTANPITFHSVSGSTVTQVVLYINSGSDSSSQLILLNTSAFLGLPITPNGSDIVLSWSPNIFSLSAPSLNFSAPSQAVSAGYSTLIFNDEFDYPLDIGFGTPGHKWNAGLWFESPSPSAFSVSSSVLTITNAEMCTQHHDNGGSSGTSFLGGYFEARLMCTDWSAFWLFCWDRPNVFGTSGYWAVQADAPSTWTNEIDIAETDYGYPNSVWNTLHKNTNGNTVADDQNFPAQSNPGGSFSPFGQWHTYGVLWQNGQVTWYVDNVQTITVADYESTWQPTQLVLTAAPGGVNGSSTSGGIQPPTTMIDWVRVWH